MLSKVGVLRENKMEEVAEKAYHVVGSSAAISWLFTTTWTWQNHLKSAVIINKSILMRSVCNLCFDTIVNSAVIISVSGAMLINTI
jgi:divalent metal cation (Fe/Co/Zn/Cd) transporter